MTYYPVQSPYPIFTDEDGTPLEDGYIYIGEAYQNPITNPITASWDTSGLYPAAQPIRTIGGYPDRNGSPGIIYVNAGAFEDYSILVQDKHGNQIYFEQSARSAIGGYSGNSLDIISDLRAISGYDQPFYVRGHSAIADGGQGTFEWVDGVAPGTYIDDNGVTILPTGGDGSGAWIRQYDRWISVKWFGAKGDNSTDDTSAIQDAVDYSYANTHFAIFFPKGFYVVTSTITTGVDMIGESDAGSRIIVKRPFVGNVFENDALGSYWNVKDLYFQHDVEADNSIDGAAIYARDIQFCNFVNVAAQMHGLTGIGIHIDGPVLGLADGQTTLTNCVVTGAAAGGPYNPAWDPTASSCRIAAFKVSGGARHVTLVNPFAESSYYGILFEGTASRICRDNQIIGGTFNTCDNCIYCGDYVQECTFVGTETIGYVTNLGAIDTDNCKQNIAYNVRPFGEIRFDTFTKRNTLEYVAGSPTVPTKKLHAGIEQYGQNYIEDDGVNLTINKLTSDGNIFELQRADNTIGYFQVTTNQVSLVTGGAAVATAISGGPSNANGGNILMYAGSSNNDIRLRIGGTTKCWVDSLGHTKPGTDLGSNIGLINYRWQDGYINRLRPGDGSVIWLTGSGTPEGAVTANVGSLYTRTDGGTSTTLYIKETGTGNTGWVAK